MAHNGTNVGWQDPPNSRGSFDILKVCTGTIFLLCWSSVCPNVPSVKTGYRGQFLAKLNLFLMGMLGPDFIFTIALGQFNAAWRARKAFREAGYDWSLRHCFFANMGGVHLQFADRHAAASFPVNCFQLLYLTKHGYITMPQISENDINDRDKADGLARVIAVVQSMWFTITSIGRATQGLFLTTMELTTLAFVFLMTGCSICWWRKPMDVSRPLIFQTDTYLSTVLQKEGAPSPNYGNTPLSFLDRQEWFMSQIWACYYKVLQDLRLLPLRRYNSSDMDHFPSIDFPVTELKWDTVGGLAIVIYSCVFMAAWNSNFPSNAEQALWQISSVMCLAYGVFGGLVAYFYHHGDLFKQHVSQLKFPYSNTASLGEPKTTQVTQVQRQESKFICGRANQRSGWMINNSLEKDPALAIPIRWWIPTTLLCAMYCFSRAYILLEDVVALRDLPRSAYQTVDWGPYSPIL